MGRFARSHSGVESARTARAATVALKPRFIKDSGATARNNQIRSHLFDPPKNFLRADQSKSQFFKLDRRRRKNMRIVGLAVLMLAGLGVGWILGKAILGSSQIDQPQPAISVERVVEDKTDKSIAEASIAPDLDAQADDVQAPQYESQNQYNQDDRSGRARNSGRSRRALSPSKARAGISIGGVIAKPIKVVFRPLKRANPLRLRLW